MAPNSAACKHQLLCLFVMGLSGKLDSQSLKERERQEWDIDEIVNKYKQQVLKTSRQCVNPTSNIQKVQCN